MEASHSFASVTGGGLQGRFLPCHDGLGEVPRQNRGGVNPPKAKQLAFKLVVEVETHPVVETNICKDFVEMWDDFFARIVH